MYIDAEAVLAALVKGYSGREDLCNLVGLFWYMCAAKSIGVYLDRVPSDANPADGPSRGDCRALIDLGATRVDASPSDSLRRVEELRMPFALEKSKVT